MNTPKLTRILAGSHAPLDAARVGRLADSAQEPNFSQLLGERRSQAAPAVSASRASGSDAAHRDAQRRTESAPADRHAAQNTRRDTPATPARENAVRQAGEHSATSKETAASPADANATGTSTAAATDDAATSTNDRSTTDAAASHAPESAAQLAQHAAEAGLPAAVAGQVVETGHVTLAAAIGTPNMQGAVTTATIQAPHLPGNSNSAFAAAAVVVGDVDLSATLPSTEPDLDPLAAWRPATATFSTTPATTDRPLNPAIVAANDFVPVSGRAAEALPLPAATNAGTAAALSLQDFTAMVEAARATSGTSLHPAASMQPLVAAPVTMPGLMPAGMFPGQALPVSTAAIAAPLGSPQWPTEMGRQFVSIAQAANGPGQVAELRLDPPELGPLRITINLNDNVAHAVFSSPHAAVRQTVENALPQLQQMLEQAGISLGQANVDDNDASGAFQNDSGSGNRRAAATAGDDESVATAGAVGSSSSRPADPNALVDTFA